MTQTICTIQGRKLYVRVPKELDHHSADVICRETDSWIQTRDVQEVLFDFSETSFCDSSGIGMLMGRYKIMKALGGTVRAVQVPERMVKILTISGVANIIPMEEKQGGK